MKLCKDCSYLQHTINLLQMDGPYCRHPNSVYSVDPVYGNESFELARHMRLEKPITGTTINAGGCGPGAILFRPILPNISFWSRIFS